MDPIDEHRAHDVLARWGIDPGATTIARAAAGTMNEVFIVGATAPTLVLRRHRHTERSLVEREHHVMDVAAGAGIPAPRAVPTLEGEPFVHQGGSYWSLLGFLAGEHAPRHRVSAARAGAMGAMLGRIHVALAEGVTSMPDAAVATSALEEASNTIERIDATIRSIRLRRSTRDDDRYALAWLEGQRAWVEECGDVTVPPPNATQAIHGDYHDANVLFIADEVSGVIDWDKTEAKDPAEEVVRATNLSFRLEPEPTTAFIAAYRRHRTLDDDDLDAAAVRYGLHRDRSVWLFSELYEHGNERLRPLISRRPFRPFRESWKELRSGTRPPPAGARRRA